MNGDPKLYEILAKLGIEYEYVEHPPAPTAEKAAQFWDGLDSTHCKNLFFRNHKGNRHYLVVLEFSNQLAIKDLEQRLRQGKLTLASERRLLKYLRLKPGSVSPFGLINDTQNHVHVFFDENLKQARRLSFHPNQNTATLLVPTSDFFRFMHWSGNSYEFVSLYDSQSS